MDYQEIVLQLILHGGNARSSSMEAIGHAKAGEMEEARRSLKEALSALNEAHKIQTDMIQKEAAGQQIELNLLMIHAQDHLMNAITVKDLAAEFVDMYEKINSYGR